MLFFPVFLPSQSKSEISWEEKDLVRKTTAEFRSDLLSRGGKQWQIHFSADATNSRKSLSGAAVKLLAVFSQSKYHDRIKYTQQ